MKKLPRNKPEECEVAYLIVPDVYETSGITFFPSASMAGKDITGGEHRRHDCEDRALREVHSRDRSVCKSKYQIGHLLHFGVEILVSIRVEIHRLRKDLCIVQHVPDGRQPILAYDRVVILLAKRWALS